MESPDTLFRAAKENRLERLAELLYLGIDPNIKDHRGYSPLMLAAYADAEDALRYLLAHGADPNTADLGGNSALMGVSFKGNLRLVEILISAGADPGRRNASGMTAHDFAVAFGRTEVAERLKNAPHGGEARISSRTVAWVKVLHTLFLTLFHTVRMALSRSEK